MDDLRRITLITRNPSLAERDWDSTLSASTRIIFVKSMSVLEYALRNAVSELHRDVERVIIDRSATSAECMDLLARLPEQFHGDLLLIRHDGAGFLSARARGEGRLLYPLKEVDVEFYLTMHGLVSERARMIA